jgi:hypothetical protein
MQIPVADLAGDEETIEKRRLPGSKYLDLFWHGSGNNPPMDKDDSACLP